MSISRDPHAQRWVSLLWSSAITTCHPKPTTCEAWKYLAARCHFQPNIRSSTTFTNTVSKMASSTTPTTKIVEPYYIIQNRITTSCTRGVENQIWLLHASFMLPSHDCGEDGTAVKQRATSYQPSRIGHQPSPPPGRCQRRPSRPDPVYRQGQAPWHYLPHLFSAGPP